MELTHSGMVGMFLLPRIVDWVVSGLFILMVVLALYGFWKWYSGQTFFSAFFRYGDGVKLRASATAPMTGEVIEAKAAHAIEAGTPVKITDGIAEAVVGAAASFSAKATELGEKFYDRVEEVVEAVHVRAEAVDDALGTDFIREPNPPEFVMMREKVIANILETIEEEKAAGNADGVKALEVLLEEVKTRGLRRIV